MSAHHGTFVPDPSWPPIEQLASEVWGPPNEKLRRKDEVRWGNNGSRRVMPSRNVWKDEEAGDGGGYVKMWQKARKGAPLPPRTDDNGSKSGDVQPWLNIKETYDYPGTDIDPRLIQVVRTKNGKPRFMQRQPIAGSDRWNWHVDDIPDHDRRLYRLAELRAAPLGEWVWICAGEKDTNRLFNAGLTATTNISGEGKWKPDYAPEFRGRHCIVLQDNDPTGERHVAQVAAALHGNTASIKVLLLPGLPPKGDVSDWLDAGHTIDELNLQAEVAPEYRPESDRTYSQTKPPPGRILTGADFIARHVPPVWLVDGVVQRGRLYACTSLTGHGKTAIWLFIACMIHTGRQVGSLEVFKGNVLILAGENPTDLEARMIGIAKALNIPHDQLPYVLPGSFPLNEQEADALMRDIAELGVPFALIVGDTASSFFPGEDENDNKQAGDYARTLRRFTVEVAGNPAVVALCHPVKHAARTNLLPRGGGAFLNELDGNLTLWSEAQGEVTELHWQGKIRGPDFPPLTFRLRPAPTGLIDEKDRAEMTIVAETMSEEAAAEHAKQTLANTDVVLRMLKEHRGWSWAKMAREAGWIDADDQPLRGRVQRAIASLSEDKLIEKKRKAAPWTLTSKGEEAAKENNHG